jgi:pilus assembly protein CpaC
MISGKDAKQTYSRKVNGGRLLNQANKPFIATCVFSILFGLIGGPAAIADDQSGSVMQATLKRVDTSNKKINLTAGTSTVVEVNVPLKRSSIGAPEVADVRVLSPRQVLVTGQQAGKTQLILWDEQENQLVFDVTVNPDLQLLRDMIKRTAPGSEVKLQSVADTIILEGKVADADQARRIMGVAEIIGTKVQNQMTVAGQQQVLLRCTFAEVDKQAVRQLGVNGWLAGSNTPDFFAVSQLGGINPVNIGGAPTGNIAQGLNFATDQNGLPLTSVPEFSIGFTRTQMQLFFQAMRQNNLLRVLAEPNLVALNGQQAEFLAGGEFPIPIAQGDDAIGVEYKNFGVMLTFTPTVIGRHKIRLNVGTEVSDIDTSLAVMMQGFSVPGLTKRRADTTIELTSGTTIAIAGLLSERIRGVVQRLPGLGDIPVLGQLFRSENYQRETTELVVLVTPEMASAMHPNQVRDVPGQNMTPPSDWELFGLGMIEGEPMSEDEVDGKALHTHPEPQYRKFSNNPDQMSLHGPWGAADASETDQ